MVGDVLSPSRVRRLGLFDPRSVSRMIEDHQAKRVDYSRNIWSLLVFSLWHDTYMGASPKIEKTVVDLDQAQVSEADARLFERAPPRKLRSLHR